MNRILRLFQATLLPFICGGAMLFAQDVAPPPAPPAPPTPPEPVTAETVETLGTEPSLEVSTEADRPARRSRRSNRSARELVAIGSDARVKEGEEFSDVVVVGGNAVVDGTVKGDLVTVLGKVRLGPKAVVNGDLVVVAGALDADPGATIKGSPVVVGGILSGLIDKFHDQPWWVRAPGEWFHHGLARSRVLPHQFAWSWAFAGVALLGCLIVTLVFPRAVAASVGMLRASPGRSFAAGVLGLVVLPPLTLLLVMTGIGVFVVPLVFAGVVIAFVFGKVAVFSGTGQRLGSMLRAGVLQKPWLAVIVGAVLFSLVYAIPYVGLFAWAAALTIGFGAVLLALFKREPRPAMALPPVTEAGMAGSAMGFSETGSSMATLARVGFWRRFLATLLDAVLIGLIVGPLMHIPKWFLLIWVIYHIALWAWKGTTIGGIVLGLRIVRVDGRPINFAVALVRSLASFFSAAVLGLGFLWAGWTRDKQSWHDKIAGTVIVKPPRGTPLV